MIIVSTTSFFTASVLTKSSMYLMKLEARGVNLKQKENVLEDIQVLEVMSKKIDSVGPETKISDLLDLMLVKRHPGFPVLGENKRFYGFIKIYDLKKLKEADRKKLIAKDLANIKYPQVSPEDNVYHALNVMIRHNLGRIPVIVEKNNKKYVKGIISKTDILKAYEHIMN